MSREHYLTSALFGDVEVTVSGLPFLSGPTRTMRYRDLAVRALCQRHNSELSRLDQAAVDAWEAMREIRRVNGVRAGIRRPRAWSEYRRGVDGRGLERWMMKVAAGLATVLHEEMRGWSVPDSIAALAFGRRPFRPGTGIACLTRIDAKVFFGERLGVGFIHDRVARQPVAIAMTFAGVPLVCTWDADPKSLVPLELDGERFTDATHHLRVIRRNDVNTAIVFAW